jgi:hypothetical protein
MSKYVVIVGNIGTVHEGNNPVDACKVYGQYKRLSVDKVGRAAGESVVLMRDDEPMHEHHGVESD